MKRKPSDIEALKERTRAITVLAAVEITVSTLKEALKGQKPAIAQLEKIERWQNECMISLGAGKGRLSSGMLKDCNRISGELDRIRLAHTCGLGTTTPATMGAWLWCLDTLVNDIRTTRCLSGRCWKYLAMTWETFSMAWEKVVKEYSPNESPSECGWMMYLDASDIITPGGTGLCLSA